MDERKEKKEGGREGERKRKKERKKGREGEREKEKEGKKGGREGGRKKNGLDQPPRVKQDKKVASPTSWLWTKVGGEHGYIQVQSW